MKLLFCLTAAFTLISATSAAALDIEGVYRIAEGSPCTDEPIDSVVLFTDDGGNARVSLASNASGIVFQLHALTLGNGGVLSGSVLPSSPNAGTFAGVMAGDHQSISGTIDSGACSAPWSFVAQRAALPEDSELTPLAQAPTVADFVGSFVAATGSLEGTLRLLQLADDRLAGNFGNDVVSSVLPFDRSHLDTVNHTLELYCYDRDGLRVKWHLGYGNLNGKLALQGYGISTTGVLYPILARKW